MGSRSRIRWHQVAKLSLGVLGCLALFGGLPSLIRRPEPPPLEPDIGLAPLVAARAPAPATRRRNVRHERHGAKVPGRRGDRDETRRGGDRRTRPARDKVAFASTGPPAVAGAAPTTAPVPVVTADAHPPPSPPPAPPTAPPPARAAPQPTGPTEFGFER
jgi:hypothetical protein